MGVPSFFGYRHLNNVFRAGSDAAYLYATVPHTASAQTLRTLWALEKRQGLLSSPPPADRATLHDHSVFPWLTIDHPDFSRYVERFQSAFRFAVVRNPYARLHSIFLTHIQRDTPAGRRFRRTAKLPVSEVLDFDRFATLLANLPEHDRHPVFSPQSDWLLYESVPYHALGAVERYVEDMSAMMAHAVPPGGTADEAGDLSIERPFRQVISPETAQLVLSLYHRDFDVLGYDTDPGAASAAPRRPLERMPEQPLYGTPLWLLVDSRAQLLVGNVDVAIRQIERVIAEGEAEQRVLPQLRLDLARIHQDRGDFDQALAVLRAPQTASLSDPEYLRALAELELRRNEPAAALKALVAMFSASDPSPSAVREIGALCALTGDLDTSLRMGHAILDAVPSGPERNRLVDALVAGLSRRGSPRYALAVLEDIREVRDLGYDVAEPVARLRGEKSAPPPVAARDPELLPQSVFVDPALQALAEETRATAEFLRERLLRKVLEANPFLFDAAHYARSAPDLGKSGLTSFEHYVRHGSRRPGVEPNTFFNHAVYLHHFAREPDTILDALVHYVVEGAPRAIDPGPFFDSKAYLRKHADVAGTSANPLNHYLSGGERTRGPFGLLPESVFNGLKQMSFNDTKLFPSSWRLGALTPDASSRTAAERRGAVYSRLSRDLPEHCTHLVLLPWVAHPGGAEQVAASTLRMLVERLGAGAVAAIGTDMASRKGFDLPEGLKLFSLSDYHEALTVEDRVEILDRLIMERKPRITYNLNSLACWVLMDSRSHMLKGETALYAAIFAYGFNEIDGTFGFHQHIEACIDHLTGIVTDNSRFPAILPRMAPILSTQAEKVHVVYTPITTTFAEPSSPSATRPRQALWMSRFAPEKRMDVLGRIAAGAPDRRFVVYGSQNPNVPPADITFLRDLPNVELAGYFRDLDDVPFDECDLFVYTSAYDGLPVALLEAAAKGLPIIAPNVGGISDFITSETGWLVSNPDAVDEYLAAMREIENDPKLVRRKVLAAQKLLRQRHSWAAFQQQLEQLPHFLPGEPDPNKPNARTGFQNVVAISLGEACQSAHQIRRYFSTDDPHHYEWLFQPVKSYPDEAAGSPFNWSITPIEAVARAISQDFAGFLKRENLEFRTEPFQHVLDVAYGIKHVHYFSLTEAYLDDYDIVEQKLGKRIDMWRKALRGGKSVLFVRQSVGDEAEAVKRLAGVIGRAYPDLLFGILAVCGSYENRQEGNVVFRRVPTNPNDWQGYNEPWNEALDAARRLFS
ncbi:MAG: DUF1796 family putative cysteine peptidase [Rhizobiaceae bacterium]|nr:DUF1796 family putative cysteine peptidase [Rhizobiaceae bacterium]